MALIHRATLTPSKIDLVRAWLPARPWAPRTPIVPGVSYRLDDPAGEVGLEAFLFPAEADDDGVVHVPLTYRAAPLDGADQHLIGTLEHSVLGRRWVYDGCGDPVWVATLAATIASGGTQADEVLDDGVRREPKVTVRGSGRAGGEVVLPGPVRPSDDGWTTVIPCDPGELVVVRRVGADPGCEQTLSATWSSFPDGVVLAGLRPH